MAFLINQTPTADQTSRGNNGITTPLDESPFINGEVEDECVGDETYALLSDRPPVFSPKNESVFDSDEKFNDYLEERVTTKGNVDMQQMNDIKVDIPGAEEAALAGEARVGIIGHPGNVGLVAATLVDHPTSVSESPNLNSIALPSNVKESNSQRKRRLAQKRNESINANKVLVVKFRPQGLNIRLEVLAMSNREANLNKQRGVFAVYTVNSAVATSRIDHLPYAQHKNQSMISQNTLDWLLDQIGETEAFEIRSGRLNLQTSKTKFVVTKSKEEWIAKGFHVINNEVKIT